MSQKLLETLDTMAAACGGKSQTARLRAVFGHVEKALKSGVSRQAVLDALHQDGFTFSMQSFEKALYRIRKSQHSDAPPKVIAGRRTHASNANAGAKKVANPPESQSKQPSLTPADFREIRNQEHDWLALSQPVIER